LKKVNVNHWLWLVGLMLVACGAPAGAATSGLPDFTGLVKQLSPAVVNISTKQTRKVGGFRGQFHGQIPPEGTPFGDFFRRFFGDPEGNGEQRKDGEPNDGPSYKTQSLGSGFVLSADGYVMTNYHVVDGADEIVVRLSDRHEYVAKLVGSDKRSDIAVLKIDAKGLPTLKMARDEVQVGEWVLAIGSPFGFDHTVTAGIVSATGRSLPSGSYVPFIQTDVAINPGNSGGPLINMDGEVVGINSQIYSRTGGFMGLSFAIPTDVAINVAEQLKDKGYVSRGWLGVLIQDVTRELAESFGMEQPRGALVSKVVPDSPAAKAGVEVGDIILGYQGKKVVYSSDLPPLVGATAVGTHATLKVLRDGKHKRLSVQIEELPEDAGGQTGTGGDDKADGQLLGMQVTTPDAKQREALQVAKGGVLVTEVDAGPAREAGVRAGDLVVKINNIAVTGVEQFRETVKQLEPGSVVPLLVQRRGGPLFLALRIPDAD